MIFAGAVVIITLVVTLYLVDDKFRELVHRALGAVAIFAAICVVYFLLGPGLIEFFNKDR